MLTIIMRYFTLGWYNHTPSQLQTARTAAEEILNDALNRRGIQQVSTDGVHNDCVVTSVCQGATSINEKVFNEKMRMLRQQRQAQVQVSTEIINNFYFWFIIADPL